ADVHLFVHQLLDAGTRVAEADVDRKGWLAPAAGLEAVDAGEEIRHPLVRVEPVLARTPVLLVVSRRVRVPDRRAVARDRVDRRGAVGRQRPAASLLSAPTAVSTASVRPATASVLASGVTASATPSAETACNADRGAGTDPHQNAATCRFA